MSIDSSLTIHSSLYTSTPYNIGSQLFRRTIIQSLKYQEKFNERKKLTKNLLNLPLIDKGSNYDSVTLKNYKRKPVYTVGKNTMEEYTQSYNKIKKLLRSKILTRRTYSTINNPNTLIYIQSGLHSRRLSKPKLTNDSFAIGNTRRDFLNDNGRFTINKRKLKSYLNRKVTFNNKPSSLQISTLLQMKPKALHTKDPKKSRCDSYEIRTKTTHKPIKIVLSIKPIHNLTIE